MSRLKVVLQLWMWSCFCVPPCTLCVHCPMGKRSLWEAGVITCLLRQTVKKLVWCRTPRVWALGAPLLPARDAPGPVSTSEAARPTVHQSDPRPANATYCLSQTGCLPKAHPLWKDVCVLMSLQELVQKHNFFWQLTPDTCPILIFTFSSVIWYQNVSGKHLLELDGSFHYCTMTLLWRFQSKDEWGRPQKVIFLACTHAGTDFSRYTLYSSLSITQCKWQQWVVNFYFVASPANRRP